MGDKKVCANVCLCSQREILGQPHFSEVSTFSQIRGSLEKASFCIC